MSNFSQFKNTENSNQWIDWIEDAIAKKHIKYYKYEHFCNIKEIGAGAFGKVYRTSWKSSDNYLALKSFFNLNEVAVKEIVNELKLQREVDFHDNIIRFHGITKPKPDNLSDKKEYLLVFEYADNGSLHHYLKNNFMSLTWNDKYHLAYQLACAVSCLHDEGVVHRDLHSNNILIHQQKIKLADFGLSKRIDEASKLQSKIFGVLPYVDPKRLNEKGKDALQKLKFNDVYSIGVLFWELSSGHYPFDNRDYDIDLAMDIAQGLRETPVPGTPSDYVKLYTECWDGELNNRPTMDQVVERLKAIMSEQTIIKNSEINDNHDVKIQLPDEQQLYSNNVVTSSNTNNSSHGELSQFIKNFDKVDIKENGEPDHRPAMNQVVVAKSEAITLQENIIDDSKIIKNHKVNTQLPDEQQLHSNNVVTSSNTNNSSHGKLSQFIQNFDKVDLKEDGEPDYRPAMNQVVAKSEAITLQENIIDNSKINKNHEANQVVTSSNSNNSLHGELSQLIQNFDQVDIKENGKLSPIIQNFSKVNNIKNLESTITSNTNKITLFENDLSIMIDELVELITKKMNEGKEEDIIIQWIVNYFNNQNITLHETYNWLLNNQNNSNSIYLLASFTFSGIGTNVDKKKAFELFQKAGNLENSVAKYSIANMYMSGDGIDKDYDKAFKLYKELVDDECLLGTTMLGYCYQNGFGTSVDSQKAFELYQKAANLGNSMAQFFLANMYKSGEYVDKNFNKTFELCKNSAEGEHSDGISMLGYCYYYGFGTNRDKKKAFELYQRASNLGNSTAQYLLAKMYKSGKIVNRDYNKAFELFKKSAEGENPGGLSMLGYCYHYGIGISIDLQKAIELYQKAADLGNSMAQHNLAEMYKNGEGVEENYKKAFELHKKSAEGEYPDGITMLGNCYHYGVGVSINKKKAFELYQKAANLGNGLAQYNLAFMYDYGDGVKKDINQAIYWYKKSAEQGDQDAHKRYKKLSLKKSLCITN